MREIRILPVVANGLERLQLPSLTRPNVSNDSPNEELVLWGTLYYTYSVIAHLRVILRGLVLLVESGNIPSAFVVCRHVFEWTAHTCYMSRNLKNYIARKDWGRAQHLQSLAVEGNRWIQDHGAKYAAPELLNDIPHPLSVPNIVAAYGEYQNQTYGLRDAKDSYGLLSEHSHPNSVCFLPYYQYVGPQVRFVSPSKDDSLLSEDRCLIDLVLFLDALLRLRIISQVPVDLTKVAALSHLTSLSIWGPPVVDLAPLRNLGLTDLQVSGLLTSRLSDITGIDAIGTLKHLSKLTLGWLQISSLHFLNGNPTLKEINLNALPISSAPELGSLASLRSLSLVDIPIVDISPLLSLPKFESLQLLRTPARADVISTLAKRGVRVTNN